MFLLITKIIQLIQNISYEKYFYDSSIAFEQEKNDRIIFVKKRTDNDDEVDFDFIEFILQKKDNFYEIITSAYSDDGRFLVMGFPVRTKKVMIENKITGKYKIVYLS